MNILLYLFKLFFDIIKATINIYYYIYKSIRQNYFDKYYYNHKVDNLFSLIFKIIFLSVYEFLVLHIYVFIYLIHDSSINFGYFGIFLWLALTILVSFLLAFIIQEFNHIIHYFIQLAISIFHLFTWLFALIFFILTFNEELRDTILFKKKFDEFGELLQIYFLVLIQLYRFILIIAHFSNIFSIIRIIEICKNQKDKDSTLLLTKSFSYIFFDIFFLTPGYVFIMLLPPVFISTHINIYKSIYNNKIDFSKNLENDEYLYQNYNIIKSQIINDTSKVLIYIIAIILTIISVPFIWKINKSFKILFELFKTKDFKQFFINYFKNLIDNLITTALSVLVLLNHLSPIHLKALYDCYYGNNNKKRIEINYLYINLTIFIEKWLDIFFFIISMLRLITINFYIYLIRKKFNYKFYFLLFDNENIIEKFSNKKNRHKIIKILFFDVLISFLMILQFLLGILNPFFALKIITDIYLYYINFKIQIKLNLINI